MTTDPAAGDDARGIAAAVRSYARDAAFRTIVEIARAAAPGCDAASITLVTGGDPKTPAWSGDVAKRADEHQYAAGDGPCLAAIEDASATRLDMTAPGERWAPILPAFEALGVTTVLSLPAVTGPDGGAALNLYSRHADAFSGDTSLVELLAREAARAIEQELAEDGRSAATASDALDARDLLVEVGTVLVTERTADDVLEMMAAGAARSLATARAASVTLTREGRTFTSNATAPLAAELDEVQYATDAGPCLHALRTGETVNADLGADTRWQELSEQAAARGVGCVLAVPLKAGDVALGVLNVYGTADCPFSAAEQEIGAALAGQGAAVLANALAFRAERALNEQLWEALETRDVIGQAKGIVMAREGCSAEVAFDILRRTSQRTNRKLRDIAVEVVAATERRSPPP